MNQIKHQKLGKVQVGLRKIIPDKNQMGKREFKKILFEYVLSLDQTFSNSS